VLHLLALCFVVGLFVVMLFSEGGRAFLFSCLGILIVVAGLIVIGALVLFGGLWLLSRAT
jgi:hypothetical protein